MDGDRLLHRLGGGTRGTIGGLLGVATVGWLLTFGVHSGFPADRPHLLSGAAWLASARAGQMTLLDGVSVEVAAQVQVGPTGESLDVVQQGPTGYAVNRSTGSVRRVDGATFAVSGPVTPIPAAGAGLQAFPGSG